MCVSGESAEMCVSGEGVLRCVSGEGVLRCVLLVRACCVHRSFLAFSIL